MKKFRLFAVFFLFPSIVACQSPYRLDWTREAVLGGAGTAVLGISVLVKPEPRPLSIADLATLNRNSVNAFDRGATNHYSLKISDASDLLCGAVIASPLLFVFDGKIRNDAMTIGVMYAETVGFAALLPYVIKDYVDRARPFVYNPSAPVSGKVSSDAVRSFFSSHTCTAFASAVFLSTVYSDYHPDSQWKPYVWVASLGAAGAVGLLRYESGMHFPTDILVGAAVGCIIGYAIPEIHRSTADGGLSISPDAGPAYSVISLRFAF